MMKIKSSFFILFFDFIIRNLLTFSDYILKLLFHVFFCKYLTWKLPTPLQCMENKIQFNIKFSTLKIILILDNNQKFKV